MTVRLLIRRRVSPSQSSASVPAARKSRSYYRGPDSAIAPTDCTSSAEEKTVTMWKTGSSPRKRSHGSRAAALRRSTMSN
jgi:hypothetical protein